jgi:diguanylate cyclase (GGDEF)-like protein
MSIRHSTTTALAVVLAATGGYLLAARHHAAATDRWREAALHDPLTGLPNRRAVYEQLMPAHPEACIAMVDIDHLKAVNTRHGHHVGDRMIAAAGTTMRVWAQVSRAHVARLAGDEFLIVLPDTTDTATAQRQIDDLLDWLSQPIQIDGVELTLSATAGISTRSGSDEQDRARAGLALRTAKRRRGIALVYDADRDGSPAPDGARPAVRSRELPSPPTEVNTRPTTSAR